VLESSTIMRQLSEVVPESLLIEIPEKMERLDADVCAFQSAFEQTPEVFKSVSMNLSFDVAFGMVNHVVSIVSNQSFVGLESVTVERRVCGNMIADFLVDCVLFAICENGCANLSATFQNSEHDCLVVRPTCNDSPMVNVAMHVPSLATDESFVYFDFCPRPTELQKRLSLHRKPNPMEHEPCGLLCDSKRTVDFVGANTILAIRNEPNCDKPLVERKRRILKDSPDLARELPLGMLRLAFPQATSGDEANVFTSAGGTHDAIRPAALNHERKAVVGIGEMYDGLLECSGLFHGFLTPRILAIWGY
jgi:hypothetical protein